jgi:hypothetical protein
MPALKPHPLVYDVGRELINKGHPGLLASVAAGMNPAEGLAEQTDQPDLRLFAGFLGAPVINPNDGTQWRLVYVDPRLYSWLLVPDNDVVAWERVNDPTAPSGKRDMLWINDTAQLVYGSGFGPTARRFLTGDLTRAADFAPQTRGGTFSAASGIVCDATTPNCLCFSSRTRP